MIICYYHTTGCERYLDLKLRGFCDYNKGEFPDWPVFNTNVNAVRVNRQ